MRCGWPVRQTFVFGRSRPRPHLSEVREESDRRHRRRGVLVDEHSMKTDIDRRANVAFGVIEKRGSVGGHT